VGISANGSIKITIEQKSTGDGGKAVNQTADAFKKAGSEAKKSTEAADGFGASMKDLKGKFAGLNQGREAFENIRSNLMFIPGVAVAFGAVTSAVGELVSGLLTAGQAQQALTESAEAYSAALNSIAGRVNAGREEMAPGSTADFSRLQQWASVAKDQGEIVANIIRLQNLIDDAGARDVFQSQADYTDEVKAAQTAWFEIISNQRTVFTSASELEQLEAKRARDAIDALGTMQITSNVFRIMAEATNTMKESWSSIRVSIGAIAGMRGSLGGVLGLKFSGGIYRLGNEIVTGGFKDALSGLPDRRRGGGGGLNEAAEFNERIRGNLRALEEPSDPAAAQRRRDRRMDRLSTEDRFQSPGWEGLDTLSHANDIAAMNEQLVSFRDTIGSLTGELGPFGGALNEIAEVWVAWGASGKDTEKAIVGSLGAIAKAGAAQIKNEQMRAGVLSIIEFGLGWASYAMYDYGAAAAHWTASAILAGTAIFGGGGSSKSAGGGNAGSRANVPRIGGGNDAMGGSVTIVNNGMWIGTGTQQETMASLGAMLGRNTGNGYQQATPR
jgi:hypothetical protein